MLVISTNLNHRFRSLNSLDIDTCDNDIIPYKIDIQNFDNKQPCSFSIQNDDENNAIHVTYRPNARLTLVNVAVVW
jgi:hypothetical protein